VVDLPLEKAWQHLARVEQWPSWAKHIKRVELQPAGELGLNSTGRMLLTNGMKTTWKVTEFNPGRNWIWVGDLLWLPSTTTIVLRSCTRRRPRSPSHWKRVDSAGRSSGGSLPRSTARLWTGRLHPWSRR
jgi:hypothetical protein